MEKDRKKKIGIIGGGAAGMTAAIAAARQGADVTILEGNERLGKKILATGNGKCNLGNRQLDTSWYYTKDPDILKARLEQFGTPQTIAFFQGMGLMIREKAGYLYPASEQAAVVARVLQIELDTLGVKVEGGCRVQGIFRTDPGHRGEAGGTEKGKDPAGGLSRQTGPGFQVDGVRTGGEAVSYYFDRVILCCGGRAAPRTGSDGSGYELAARLGHRIVPVVPALVQLKCRETFFRRVAGVRADAQIAVYHGTRLLASERGELQITEYGISGIPVFQISRVVNYILAEKGGEVKAVIDFFPDYQEEAYKHFCAARVLLQDGRSVEDFFTGMLNQKLMGLFLHLAGITDGSIPVSGVPSRNLQRVYQLCRGWEVHVTGSNSYDSAQVCAGGVPLCEITDRMESRLVPGLFLAGELLDVDGKCGGYNLQWAWCSGYLAGMGAAQ